MSDTKRIIIGSETNDDRKIILDELGTKITLPVSLYNSSGTQIDTIPVSGTVAVTQGTSPWVVGDNVASSTTTSNIVSSASNVTLLAANANRKMATFFNDSTQILYLKLGATATTSSYTVQIKANGYYELPRPIYTGIIEGLWASANGNCRITEI